MKKKQILLYNFFQKTNMLFAKFIEIVFYVDFYVNFYDVIYRIFIPCLFCPHAY